MDATQAVDPAASADQEPQKWEIIRRPDTADFEREIGPILKRSEVVKVTDQASLDAAAKDLAALLDWQKRWKQFWYNGKSGEKNRGPYGLAKELSDKLYEMYKAGDAKPEAAVKRFKDEQARYILAEQARREAEARKAQQKAEEEERKRREAEAAEMKRKAAEEEKQRKAEAEAERKRLEAEGASKREMERLKREQDEAAARAKAQAAADIAAMKAASIAVAAAPAEKVQAAGLAIPMVWVATVIDADAVPREYLGPPDIVRLQMAKKANEKLVVPGVAFKKVPKPRSTGR